MRTELFDFDLPEDLIALRPAPERDGARLLVVRPGHTQALSDCQIVDLASLLEPGDALVFNNTRVLPAALQGLRRRAQSEVNVSFNLVHRTGSDSWQTFAKPGRRLGVGDRVTFAAHQSDLVLTADVTSKQDDGLVALTFNRSGADLDGALLQVGRMPLPPYIAAHRSADETDNTTYQTIFAKHDGAVAAPTAGLHFTERLLASIEKKGVTRHDLTLHVGAGTFLPVKTETTDDHVMHSEWGEVSAATAAELNAVRAHGGRIIAVGTTSLRLLESAADRDGRILPFSGDTDIFMTPGYRFKAADGLLTNFHLPKSTLFMLVSAFSGLEQMQSAYDHAIKKRYRFYSYGDATLLFPAAPKSAK
ncbi:MAG: tRNA preQ1(34) S-adenosylmethionine ribosyltransferase-isomerase QueA [Hyphomicrobiaceae bacterium]